MSLLFYIGLLASLVAFAVTKKTWIAAVAAYCVTLLLCGSLVFLHGDASIRLVAEAMRPFLLDALTGELAGYLIVKTARYLRTRVQRTEQHRNVLDLMQSAERVAILVYAGAVDFGDAAPSRKQPPVLCHIEMFYGATRHHSVTGGVTLENGERQHFERLRAVC